MKILNGDITKISFSDVIDFCKEGIPEGTEIDYKSDFPGKGIAKFIAAFSNTRGGVLVIGVTEDKATGLPIAWDGVDDNTKYVEQIYQNIANITPIPNIKIHKTLSESGKVFILIRIFEGECPPYYVQNESNVWVRTGSITNPIELSKPDYLELLFGKREKAEKYRNIYIHHCAEVYKGALKLEEKERLRLIAEAKRKGDGSEKGYFQEPLGSNTSLCESVLMPFYPAGSLTKLADLSNKLQEISRIGNFPDPNLTSMPEGLYHYSHNFNGLLSGHQFYANGVINALLDVLRIDSENGRRNLEMYAIAWNIYHVLSTGKKLYNAFGYNGVLNVITTLSNIENVWLSGLTVNEMFFFDKTTENLLSNYVWEKVFSTTVLNDTEQFKELFKGILNDINWSFGFGELNNSVADKFIAGCNMRFD